MKKILALLLVLVLAFTLVACGSGSDDDDKDKSSKKKDNTSNVVDNKDKDEDKNKKPAGDITFTEQVIVDNDTCAIKVTSCEIDDFYGLTFKVAVENKTEDKDLTFSMYDTALNSVETYGYFYAEVAAGKKSNEDLTFDLDDLEENGITEITDVLTTFTVREVDDYTDYLVEETVHLYPYGEDKAEKYERPEQDGDEILLDNDYVTVIMTGNGEDDYYAYCVNLYIINKSDINLLVSTDNDSVNGYMVDPYFSTTINSGNVEFAQIAWYEDDFEENEITSVDEIEFDLLVGNSDDWEIDDIANVKVTITP